MKNRWIGGLALATALLLGACAPPNQGAGESPSQAAASSAPASQSAEPSESAESMESTEASESAAPDADDDYDY